MNKRPLSGTVGQSVRINDRGPFVAGPRIIDLSRAAAQRLGMPLQGQAAVRVRRIEPSEGDRRRLLSGKAASEPPPVTGKILDNLRGQFSAAGMSLTVESSVRPFR